MPAAVAQGSYDRKTVYWCMHGTSAVSHTTAYLSTACVLHQEAKVWVPDPDMVWRCAILLEDFKGQKKLKVVFEEDGEVRSCINVNLFLMCMFH